MAAPLGNLYNRRWKDVKELKKLINQYFKACIKDKRPFTVSGLAIALGIDRNTLLNYQENYGKDFRTLIKAAKGLCENYAEESLFTKSTVAGVIFNLKNNYRWIEEQTIKHSGLGQLLKSINEEKESPIKTDSSPRQKDDAGGIEGESKEEKISHKQSVLDKK